VYVKYNDRKILYNSTVVEPISDQKHTEHFDASYLHCLDVKSGPNLAPAIVKLLLRRTIKAITPGDFTHFCTAPGPHSQKGP
jgi:hypothetical protein